MSPSQRRFPPVKIMGGDADTVGGRGVVPGGGVSAWLRRDGEAGVTADGVGGALGVAAIGISSDTTGKEMSSAVIGTATTAGKAGGEAGRAD